MNKHAKSLRWVVNQIPDFKPTTNEEKMLVAIKLYSEAGAEEIRRLEVENAKLKEMLSRVKSGRVSNLKSENTFLRERLEKTEKEIDEYKRKIKYGKLVEPVWFISFMNDLPCYGRVIGYQEDSGFVMDCADSMISAKKIYLSEEEAEKELNKESKD